MEGTVSCCSDVFGFKDVTKSSASDWNSGLSHPKVRLREVISNAPRLGLYPNDLLCLFERHLKEGRLKDAYVAIFHYLDSMQAGTHKLSQALERHYSSAQNVQNKLLEQFWEESQKWIREQQLRMETFQWLKLHNDFNLLCRTLDLPDPLQKFEDLFRDYGEGGSCKVEPDTLSELECLLADPSVMSMARLKEVLDKSKNPTVLERCRAELKKRKEITEQWNEKKVGSYTKACLTRLNSTKLPKSSQPTGASVFYDSLVEEVEEPQEIHRFFHAIKTSTSDPSRKRFLYYHFRGENPVRHLEVSRSKPSRLLVQGESGMPIKTLTELGLPLLKGAEISQEKFDLVWLKYGGRPWMYEEDN